MYRHGGEVVDTREIADGRDKELSKFTTLVKLHAYLSNTLELQK